MQTRERLRAASTVHDEKENGEVSTSCFFNDKLDEFMYLLDVM